MTESDAIPDPCCQEVICGTSITIVPEDDNRPTTVRVKRKGRNDDGVLTIFGRKSGTDHDDHWHQNPQTGRWRPGKPRLQVVA